MAKKEETIFSNRIPNGKKLNVKSLAGQVLIALRDYAHHFAISYHKKINKIVSIAIFICLTAFSSCFSLNKQYTRVTIDNFGDLKDTISKVVGGSKEKTLIVFDVDRVLIETFRFDLAKFFLKYDAKGKLSERDRKIESIVRQSYPGKLMDEGIVPFIKQLQTNNYVKVMCLTSAGFGNFWCIPSLAEHRIKELKEVGIDLSKEFSDYPDGSNLFILNKERPYSKPYVYNMGSKVDLQTCLEEKYENRGFESPKKMKKRSIFYKKGILFSPNFPKNRSLNLFVSDLKKETGWKPLKIIFVDDQEGNLDTIKKYLDRNFALVPKYTLIHYTRAKKLEKKFLQGIIPTFKASWAIYQAEKELEKMDKKNAKKK